MPVKLGRSKKNGESQVFKKFTVCLDESDWNMLEELAAEDTYRGSRSRVIRRAILEACVRLREQKKQSD